MQQLVKIFKRECYDMVIWAGDPPAEDSFAAALLSIASILPDVTFVAGKKTRDAQHMKAKWTKFIAEKGSHMLFDIHEVPDAAFADHAWVALGGILQQQYGLGDVHFFGGGENSVQELAALDAEGVAVYAYDVVREKNGLWEHSSRLRTMVANCHGSHEDGPGVLKHIRVLAQREYGISRAAMEEPVPLRKLQTQLPSPSPELVTDGLERLTDSALSRGMHVENVASDGACQFRALALQLWGDQEKHIQVREAVVRQLTAHSAQYEAFVEGQSFSEYCEKMKQRQTWGDHLTLQAAADVYRLQVNLFTTYRENDLLRISPSNHGAFSQQVWLGFVAEMHYVSLTGGNSIAMTSNSQLWLSAKGAAAVPNK